MIRLEISKNGTQKLTEVCDKCQCHVRDLSVKDILVKGKTDLKIYDEDGKEVTRKEHDLKTCTCEHCNHD